MKKRLLAMLVTVVILASLLTTPVMAANMVSYGFGSNPVNTVYTNGAVHPAGADYGSALNGTKAVYAGAGKDAADVAMQISRNIINPSGGYSSYWFNRNLPASRVKFAYSVLSKTTNSNLIIGKSNYYESVGFPNIDGTSIKLGNNTIGSINANEWYRIVIDVNLSSTAQGTLEAGKYDYYINGKRVLTNETKPTYFAPGWCKLSFTTSTASSEGFLIDDYLVSDDAYTPCADEALASSSSDVSIDLENKTISVPSGTAAINFTNLLTVSDGNTIKGVYRPSTNAYITNTNVQDGDKLVVTAADNVYKYYTVDEKQTTLFENTFTNVTVGDKSWSQMSGGDYIIDGSALASVGGKTSTDVSAHIYNRRNASENYYMFKLPGGLNQVGTFEFDFLVDNNTGYNYIEEKWGLKFFNVRPDGRNNGFYGVVKSLDDDNNDATFVNEPHMKIGTWNHIAVEINFSDSTVGELSAKSYNVYVNGNKVITNLSHGKTWAQNQEFRFYGDFYLDNFKITCAPYKNEYAQSIVTSKDSNINVVEAGRYITYQNLSVSDYIAKFDIPAGVTASIVDGATCLTKTSGNIAAKDLLALTDAKGNMSYYSIAQEYVADVKFYTAQKDDKGKIIDTTEITNGVVAVGNIISRITVSSFTPYDAQLIIAIYNDGRLEEIQIKDAITNPQTGVGTTFTIQTDSVNVKDATKESVKVFLWDSLESIKPIKTGKLDTNEDLVF